MNEQKWRLKGTQITGETIGSHFVFYPDGWPDGCYMYVHPDMLEPADAPVVDAPDLGRRVKALEEQADRHATWLKPILDAVMFRLTHIEAALDWQDDGAHTLIDLERCVKTLEDWRDWYTDAQNKNAVNINKRLCALEADPAPDQPLKVGDEVWVKGMLVSNDKSVWPYEINFGYNARLWIHKSTEIERA